MIHNHNSLMHKSMKYYILIIGIKLNINCVLNIGNSSIKDKKFRFGQKEIHNSKTYHTSIFWKEIKKYIVLQRPFS
jgi:hypothetical protein